MSSSGVHQQEERPFPMALVYESNTRMTTPAENYRCPVSTPANQYVQRHPRIRRTKPLNVLYSQPSTAVGKGERARGFPLSRHCRNQHNKLTLQPGNSLDYYFVDKNDDRVAEEQTNTHWLKALCSQPVDEIMKKYRRKSDVKRTKIIWSKTFSTPGERSLLQAWESPSQVTRYRFRQNNQAQSAIENPSKRRLGSKSSKILARKTQSEPSMSRTQNLDLVSGSVTPVTVHRDEDIRQCFLPLESPRGAQGKEPPSPPGAGNNLQAPILSSKDYSPRVKTYTTQYFAPKPGVQGVVRAKVVSSPQHLPFLCTRHRVARLIQEEHGAIAVDPTPAANGPSHSRKT